MARSRKVANAHASVTGREKREMPSSVGDVYFENVQLRQRNAVRPRHRVFHIILGEFVHHLSAPKISQTNPTCLLKTEVVCDRRPPSIVFQLIPSVQAEAKLKKIELSSANLSTLELLKLCNKHVSALAPKEIATSVVKTKSEKKAGGAGGGGKRR
uniref:uncharacterized protein LOC120957832 isoform X1 n=1 Tax=Anopheles coluzzii TaxID=1518534 RepID=UPI0020FF8BBD|nr:uncharacterized protein LOC120957832 isoform X1 [Anopheles coluzzii]